MQQQDRPFPATGVADSPAFGPFTLLLALALICILISACGQPPRSPTSSLACGTVTSTQALSKNASETGQAMRAGSCFLHAYQQCQAATLVYVDQDRLLRQDQQRTMRTLTVEAASCRVSETLQKVSSSTTSLCDRVEGLRGALRLVSCGVDGTFSLILDATIQ
ncbi:hypothetical protein [Thermogemmatispora tikiterensis]|uniref:Uncharacterized protein n=1 Tax=Thermogemmatispora tikiterensis TaxID=1825093 RepID=A0A328VNY6_9CHLR|nr:hypothetical protein [Thermogemmatispora tikiterensis]RAQ97383.1 hypothetical protein A4R35_17735 [Thermogemmatispora tikiterensis]